VNSLSNQTGPSAIHLQENIIWKSCCSRRRHSRSRSLEKNWYNWIITSNYFAILQELFQRSWLVCEWAQESTRQNRFTKQQNRGDSRDKIARACSISAYCRRTHTSSSKVHQELKQSLVRHKWRDIYFLALEIPIWASLTGSFVTDWRFYEINAKNINNKFCL